MEVIMPFKREKNIKRPNFQGEKKIKKIDASRSSRNLLTLFSETAERRIWA